MCDAIERHGARCFPWGNKAECAIEPPALCLQICYFAAIGRECHPALQLQREPLQRNGWLVFNRRFRGLHPEFHAIVARARCRWHRPHVGVARCVRRINEMYASPWGAFAERGHTSQQPEKQHIGDDTPGKRPPDVPPRSLADGHIFDFNAPRFPDFLVRVGGCQRNRNRSAPARRMRNGLSHGVPL